MSKSTAPENVIQPPIYADTLRVEYSIKVNGRAGLFMDYYGMFDLPRALAAKDVELNMNLYSTMIDQLAVDGSVRCFGQLLMDHVAQSLSSAAKAPKATPDAGTPVPPPMAPWWEEFARPGGSPPPSFFELNKPADDCVDPRAWAAYERRLAEWRHQQEVMEAVRNAGIDPKSTSRPATATPKPADSPAPRRDTTPAATGPAPTPAQKSASAQSPFQMPGDASVPATPKRTPRESETKPPAFDPTPFKTVSDICSESPLAKAA